MHIYMYARTCSVVIVYPASITLLWSVIVCSVDCRLQTLSHTIWFTSVQLHNGQMRGHTCKCASPNSLMTSWRSDIDDDNFHCHPTHPWYGSVLWLRNISVTRWRWWMMIVFQSRNGLSDFHNRVLWLLTEHRCIYAQLNSPVRQSINLEFLS